MRLFDQSSGLEISGDGFRDMFERAAAGMPVRIGVRVTTDPWPLGDAPIQSFSTFEALLLQARPQLSWKGFELHSDEDQLRQTTAEAVLWREMQRCGIVMIIAANDDSATADERIDCAERVLRKHFKMED